MAFGMERLQDSHYEHVHSHRPALRKRLLTKGTQDHLGTVETSH